MGIDDDGGLLPGLRDGDGDGCIGGATGGSDGAAAGLTAEGLMEGLAEGLGEGNAEGLSEGDTAGDRLAEPSPVIAAQQPGCESKQYPTQHDRFVNEMNSSQGKVLRSSSCNRVWSKILVHGHSNARAVEEVTRASYACQLTGCVRRACNARARLHECAGEGFFPRD